MRVIAGEAKGITLKSLVHRELRPTSQKVREALFNIVARRIEGCDFLDLFAGVGTIGIEALSRGARSAMFVEKDRKALQILRQNIESAGMKDRSRVIAGDVQKTLRHIEADSCDIVFLDPPYEFVRCQEVLTGLTEKGILRRNGIVIVEHYHKNYPVIASGGLSCVRSEKYGQTVLSFLRLHGENEGSCSQPEAGC